MHCIRGMNLLCIFGSEKTQNYCDSFCGVCKCFPQKLVPFERQCTHNCKGCIQTQIKVDTMECLMVSTCAAIQICKVV
jgi:hypothetical protein